MSQKSEFDARIAAAGIRRISRSRKISLKGAQRIALPSFLTQAHSTEPNQGSGLALFSKRKGMDPRQYAYGYSAANYSAIRTLSFGINLNF